MMDGTQKNIHCLLRFRESAEESGSAAERHAETLRALAEALECASDEIRIVDAQEDGDSFTLEMSETLFEHFLKKGEADEQWLRNLGILLVKEILDEPYDLSRIRRMLSKIFSEEELRSFCGKYFSELVPTLPADMKKAQMIDVLLDFARQRSRVPHILVLAEQRNSELFKKFEPYHLPARIFPGGKKKIVSQTAFRTPFFNLKLSEFFKASLLGSGLAGGLTFLLRRAMMASSDAFLNYLLLGGIALIGMFTGEIVLKFANHKRGKLLSIVGIGSYLVGSFLGNALLVFTLMGFQISSNMLVNALVFGLSGLISSGLAILLGMFLAYKNTR